jgi:ketosteroid isomerase-like protein
MSQENVKVVEAALAAFNRRDVQALANASHEDIEFVSVLAELDAGTATFRGRQGWVRDFEVMEKAWAGWSIENIRIFDATEDKVVTVCSIGGTDKLSGVSVRQTVGIAYRLSEGKMWRIRSYSDARQALETVGRSE